MPVVLFKYLRPNVLGMNGKQNKSAFLMLFILDMLVIIAQS